MKPSLRSKYLELKVLVIDEISIVSNDLLFNIHLRLVEIFGCQGNKPFAGLTVITIGDFFQLQLIRARPVYMQYGDTWKPLWRQFKRVELTEVIQKQGNNQLIKILNCNRIAKLDDEDTATLKYKFIDPITANLQNDTLHIFAENASADTHNLANLEVLDSLLHNMSSIILTPKNV